MGHILYIILVGLVIVMLLVNLYFGMRFYNLQKQLRLNRVPMSFKYVFNKELRERELFPAYGKHRHLIEKFSNTILASIKVATIIFIGIIVIGIIFIAF